MPIADTVLPSSVLALVSTYHVALLLLRRHRSFPNRTLVPLLLPSVFLAAQPWVQPRLLWVAIGAGLHLAWFVACERLLPRPVIPTAVQPASASRHPAPQGAAPAPSRRSPGFVEAPVLAVIDETPEIRTFRLARPEGMEFQAGQFVTVRVTIDGAPLARCYSISSAPATRGYLEISVRRQGRVSSLLHSTVRPGSRLSIAGPAGTFVYPAGDQRPLVLLAGGIGITPLLSMLRHGLGEDPGRPITLIYAARTAAHLAFADELLVLSRRHPQLTLHLLVTREAPAPPLAAGRVEAAGVAGLIADPAGAIFLMCGPQEMIDALHRDLPGLGVPGDQIRSEAFEAAAAAREGAVGHTTDSPAPPIGTGFRLTLHRSRREAALGPTDSLLDAAEAAGADIPSSCRSGLCLTCRCRLLSGDVQCDSDILDAADRADGYILPCVSWARSDCILDA